MHLKVHQKYANVREHHLLWKAATERCWLGDRRRTDAGNTNLAAELHGWGALEPDGLKCHLPQVDRSCFPDIRRTGLGSADASAC